MRQGGDSYYVLVDKDGNVYQKEDFVDTYVVEFDSWEEAEEELAYLLDTEEDFNEEDGWHVERHRW